MRWLIVAVRTTYEAVGGIIELDTSIVPTAASFLPFLTAASVFVDDCCTGEAGPGTAYSDDRLELIERWLAAHLYTNRDPRMTNEKAGSVGGSYQSKVDLGFDTSHYGQTAMRLDTNGGLSKLNDDMKKGKPTVGIVWLGTSEDDTD